jgi:hypothetical protein
MSGPLSSRLALRRSACARSLRARASDCAALPKWGATSADAHGAAKGDSGQRGRTWPRASCCDSFKRPRTSSAARQQYVGNHSPSGPDWRAGQPPCAACSRPMDRSTVVPVDPIRISLIAKPSVGSRTELDPRGARLASRRKTAKGVRYFRPVHAVRCRSSRAHPDLATAIDRMPRIERKAVQADVAIVTVYLFKLLAAGMA